MAEVYRERERERYRDYREDPESDDERYRSTTVTRYKVPRSDRHDRAERVVDVDDAGRSHFSSQNPRGSGDHLDVGGRDRGYAPDRPRSAFEPSAYDRDRYYDREDRSRVSGYGGSGFQERERGSDWDRRGRDEDVRVEKRTEERYDDSHGHEVERIRKETEYYAPQESGGAPIVIRQRPEPQKIIFQEAPPAAPLVLTRAARDREYEGERQLARREREDDYYRQERREVGPYRGDPREDDRAYAMSRYDRDRDRRREDDEYYMHRRKVVRRESSASDDGHKRELAGGALAGAGITALLSSRRDADGDLPANRGKKVIAGAALGALGTEAIKRARSAYGERRGDRDQSPDDHSRLKKGLGIAAVALAAAGAAQYYKSNKVDKEESRRGRSRSRRHSHYNDHDRSLSRTGYYSRTPSRSVTPPRSKSRRRSLSRAATAVLGTAGAAAVVKKLRDRSKSKARSASRGSRRSRSRSRSKSRLRRAAEIGGVAATAGIASKMWKNHRDKKADERSRSRGYDSADDRDYHRGGRGGRGYSRSRSRSLVEYGDSPLPPNRDYEDEAAERRRRRRLRSRSASSSAPETEKRSKSRLRNMAAAGAAAIGVNQLMGRNKDEDRRSRERESRERERIRRRSRRRSQGRLYDDDLRDDDYFNDRDRRRPDSPPMASGGAYYNAPYPGTPGPGPAGAPYAQFPNPSQPNVNDYQPYIPHDYMGYPPAPAPGPPPPGPPGPPPPGPPPPGGNIPPAYP